MSEMTNTTYQEFAGVASHGSQWLCRECSWSGDYEAAQTHAHAMAWPEFPPSAEQKELERRISQLQSSLAEVERELYDIETKLRSARSRGASTLDSWISKRAAAETLQSIHRAKLEELRGLVGPFERARSEARYIRFQELGVQAFEEAFDETDTYVVESLPVDKPDGTTLPRLVWHIATGIAEAPFVQVVPDRELGFQFRLMDQQPDHQAKPIFGFEATLYGPQHRYSGWDYEKAEPVYELQGAYVTWGSSSSNRTTRTNRASLVVYELAIRLAEKINEMFGIAVPPIETK